MESFPVHVKTLDALHLATILYLRSGEPEEHITLFSHERSLNLYARALGFEAALL